MCCVHATFEVAEKLRREESDTNVSSRRGILNIDTKATVSLYLEYLHLYRLEAARTTAKNKLAR